MSKKKWLLKNDFIKRTKLNFIFDWCTELNTIVAIIHYVYIYSYFLFLQKILKN